ncbi:MAG: DUF5050 domain-containing protein [Clostridia bacterium]|nr:DUF5050 domain-containing protein [Clostridia bacterium]
MNIKKLFAVALIGCVMLAGCGKSDSLPENMGNTNGNISNIGSVCQRGDTVYYQNDKDNFSIYKSVKDGEGEKLNDGTSYFINVVGDYVYYVHEDDDFHVFKMKTDGSENTEIIKQAAYYMTVYNDMIYFVNYDDNQAIYSAKTDGSDLKKIVDSQCYYSIIGDDGLLYYVDYSNGGKVTRANLDGSEQTVIDENNPVTAAYLNYYKGKLYYTNATEATEGTEATYVNNIFCYDLESGSVSTILEKECADVNVSNDKIYYSSLEDNKVYRCDLDGENEELLYDNNGIFLNVTDDYVYCFVKLKDEDPYIEKVSIKKSFSEKMKTLYGKD